MSLNNSRIADYLYLAYPNDLEVKDMPDVLILTLTMKLKNKTLRQK